MSAGIDLGAGHSGRLLTLDGIANVSQCFFAGLEKVFLSQWFVAIPAFPA